MLVILQGDGVGELGGEFDHHVLPGCVGGGSSRTGCSSIGLTRVVGTNQSGRCRLTFGSWW